MVRALRVLARAWWGACGLAPAVWWAFPSGGSAAWADRAVAMGARPARAVAAARRCATELDRAGVGHVVGRWVVGRVRVWTFFANAFRRRFRTASSDLSAGRGAPGLVRYVRLAVRVGAAGIGLPVRHHGLLFSAVSPPGRHRVTH
ncbi:hypothetical protein Ais01nite_63710 [Asanoa ishikariensis]|nr:hypothetical protein Ais01nite_63710 [Asanoa ishikariensis]